MEPEVQNNYGGARIVVDKENSIAINVRTLDDYVAEQSLKQIDVIKIDVEGFELNVLTGGKSSIESYRPKLFVEVHFLFLCRCKDFEYKKTANSFILRCQGKDLGRDEVYEYEFKVKK